jgi:hypothetical protein
MARRSVTLVVIRRADGRSDNSPHILGTLVPVEEPSTASEADAFAAPAAE